jgi:hypothetical protein
VSQPGLSEGDATALEQFARSIQKGLDQASPVERRRTSELLRLKVRISNDTGNSVQLGRSCRFTLESEAVFEV